MKEIWPKHVPITPEALSRCSRREARKLLPHEFAAKLGVLPLGVLSVGNKEVLHALTREGDGANAISTLKFRTGLDVRILEVPTHTIERAIFLAYRGDEEALSEELIKTIKSSKEDTLADSLYDFRSPSGGDAGSLLSALVDHAVSKKASDVHLLPRRDGTYFRIRKRGELITSSSPIASPQFHETIVNRIKILAKLDTTCKTKPQDGSFLVKIPGSEVFVRVGVFPTIHGEKVSLRLIAEECVPSLSLLGLTDKALSFLFEVVDTPYGMILFSGPTGSGKSTSMYSLMKEVSLKPLNLMSVEDPVEIRLDEISQSEVGGQRGITYASSLRAILRQDPDVILVGEIRDEESAAIAFQAAITGHLIVSTVHASNVHEVFLRLSHLLVDSLTASQALRVIISQRLIPSLCPSCATLDLAGSNLKGFEVRKPIGCAVCDYTGFADRVLATEALRIDRPIRDLLTMGIGDYLKNVSGVVSEENYSPLISSLDSLLVGGRISLTQYEYFLSQQSPFSTERLHACAEP